MAKSAKRAADSKVPGRAKRNSNGSTEVPGDQSFAQTGEPGRKRDAGPV
jgi:hypothetical protein